MKRKSTYKPTGRNPFGNPDRNPAKYSARLRAHREARRNRYAAMRAGKQAVSYMTAMAAHTL